MDVVLGLDIGSSRIKAAAFDDSGTIVAHGSRPTPRRTRAGLTDFRVLEMIEACRLVIATFAPHGFTVRGLGITAMGEVGTVIERGHLANIDFPAWHDDRGHEAIDALVRSHGSARLASATGGHFRTVSSLAKLAWLRSTDHVPNGVFVNVASAVAWTLTGVATQDGSLASTTGVVDPVQARPAMELWEQSGLAGIDIAPIDPPQTSYPATTEVSQSWGLPRAIPVMVAGHDHPVASVGTGALPGFVIDSLGTGEPLLASPPVRTNAHDRAIIEGVDLSTHSVEMWPSTGDLLVIAEGLRPGLAMSAFLALSGLTRAPLDLALPLNPSRILEDAEVAQLERGTLAIAPTVESWSNLHWYFTRRAAELDAGLRHVTGATGPTVVTGGGIRSRPWVEMKAAASAEPLLVSTVMEAGTRGAAAMVGCILGWWQTASDMPNAGLVAVDSWLSQDH